MNTQLLKEFRHALHRNPELGNYEYKTAELIEKSFAELGIPTKRLTETGMMAVLKFEKPGKTVALRADMDALPLTEETGTAYTSVNPGCMHACGHDVHMAAALGTAMLLLERKAELCGEVRFLFQPDEEGNGGAKRLIEAGALKDCKSVFGGHVEPSLPYGKIGVRYGKFYAASDMFNINVIGKSCHGAEPEKGIDALYAACILAAKLKSIPTLISEKCVVTVGTIHSGTARNILAGEAALSGIMRTLGEDTRLWAREQLKRCVSEAEKETGASIAVELIPSYPGVVNHEKETALAESAAVKLFGKENVIREAEPTMTTEDFGYYLMETGGTFLHIGVGGEYPLHNQHFLPGDEVCETAARLYAQCIMDCLESEL